MVHFREPQCLSVPVYIRKQRASTDAKVADTGGGGTSLMPDNEKIPGKEKGPLMTRIKDELKHYWIGTKLFGAEMKISFRLLAKIMSGQKLMRRERRQLKRTMGDLARLVPFIVILIIPFMELALPIIVKLFPGFLPSTFHTEDSMVCCRVCAFVFCSISKVPEENKEAQSPENKAGGREIAPCAHYGRNREIKFKGILEDFQQVSHLS